MKQIILTVIVAVMTLTIANAQGTKKYEKLWYTNTKVETEDVTVSIESAVADNEQLKFKLKIANKTNDYIIFKPNESKYVANGTEYKPKEKELVIGPMENDSRVVNIIGTYNSTPKGEYIIDGLYKISPKGNSIITEDLKLPLTKPEFTTGGFTVVSEKVVKESAATKLTFSVSYSGDKVGCIFTRKPTMLMPDNNEYLCEKPGALSGQPSMIMLTNGKKDKFELTWERKVGGKFMDMQFAVMTLKWNDTFCETKPEQEKTVTIPFDIDLQNSK